MSGSFRIAGHGRLTPARVARFSFDGQNLAGFPALHLHSGAASSWH